MEFRMGNFVVRKTSSGYEILKYDANAVAYYTVCDTKNMWFDVEPFDSFIKAVRFLKANHEDLI